MRSQEKSSGVYTMRILSTFLILIFLMSTFHNANANASVERQVWKCSLIRDRIARLDCFDDLAARVEGRNEQTVSHKTPGWRTSTEVDPLDDSQNVYMVVKSTDPVETWLEGTVRPGLWLQCVRGKTSGFIYWGFIVGGGKKDVTYRIDSQEPKTATLLASDDFVSLSSWDSTRVINFIKSIFGKKRLLVQVTPGSEGPVTATFNIRGIETAIQPLRDSCGW